MDLTQIARRWLRGGCLVVALSLTALLSGCGGGTNPVEGQLVWKDGSPAKELQGSFVLFELSEKQTSARGMIQADGSFRLTTNKPNDGALAGEHTVMVVEVGRQHLGGPDGTALAPGVMDARFSDPRTSGLKATVRPATNKITLTVEHPPRR
jgi:hypothetical protein